MPDTNRRVDVVVVGAGPTGLMAAVCLQQLGVSVAVVDGKSGPTRESRALVLQARSMELYDQVGLVDRVLAEAVLADAIVPGFETRGFRRIDLHRLATAVTPFPRLYVLEQSSNERLLVDAFLERGGVVEWNQTVVGLDMLDSGGCAVRCTGSAGSESEITARYVIGADGSSSAVRNLAAIGFAGVTNPHTYFVLDAEGVDGLALDAMNLRFGADDFLLGFPMGGGDHLRLLGLVRNPEGSGVAEPLVRETLLRIFAVTYRRAAWFSTYQVHHRIAEQFRRGPVFLAGDAAHVHSPVGAQGMNTGLQDAHNLATKLADVLADRAADEYLDRYEAERRPVARRLVSTTDTMFGIITSDRRFPRFLRRRVLPVVAPVVVAVVPGWAIPRRIFGYLSQTRIHYRMGATGGRSETRRRDPVVGRRLPWNGDNHEALRSMAWSVHGYGAIRDSDRRRLVAELAVPVMFFPTIRNRVLRSGYLYVVRPDGFVAGRTRADRPVEDLLPLLPPGLRQRQP